MRGRDDGRGSNKGEPDHKKKVVPDPSQGLWGGPLPGSRKLSSWGDKKTVS